MIGTQAAERDAPLGAVVHERALAVVTARLAAITHIHLATALATAQKPREKKLPAPYRPSGQSAFAGRIVGNHLLVPLELAPADIALVLSLEQHVPFRQWAPQAALDALAAILDADLARRAPKSIGAGIDGIGQDIVHGIVEWQSPDDAVPIRSAIACSRQGNALITQPHVHLSHALQLGELGEDQPEGVLYPPIWILLDPVTPDPQIAGRDTEEQRAAARLLLQRLL